MWYALSKTQSEQAAWALAMDRMLNMVSINAGLVLGPRVTQQNHLSTMSYLNGTSTMPLNIFFFASFSLSFDSKCMNQTFNFIFVCQRQFHTGAAQMYENGVLAFVDVNFLADVHVRALEDRSTCGRYFCFNRTVNTEEEAVKLAKSLSPLISLPPRSKSKTNFFFFIMKDGK